MEITKDMLTKQLAEMEAASQTAFANYHRAQAVMSFIRSQITQLDTPAAPATQEG